MVEQKLYRARKTVNQMLRDRKFGTRTDFIDNYAFSQFSELYKQFNNFSNVFDIEATNVDGEKTYVKFIKTINGKTNLPIGITDGVKSNAALSELKETYKFIKYSSDMKSTDTVVFIICYGDDLHNIHIEFEKDFPKVQCFHINRLITNITHHSLVPKHEVLSDGEIHELKKSLRLDTVNKLPVILKSDPIAKYFNMLDGDVCRITRPSKNSGTHICYRVCEEFSEMFENQTSTNQ